jgi:hypothetical protein
MFQRQQQQQQILRTALCVLAAAACIRAGKLPTVNKVAPHSHDCPLSAGVMQTAPPQFLFGSCGEEQTYESVVTQWCCLVVVVVSILLPANSSQSTSNPHPSFDALCLQCTMFNAGFPGGGGGGGVQPAPNQS